MDFALSTWTLVRSNIVLYSNCINLSFYMVYLFKEVLVEPSRPDEAVEFDACFLSNVDA